MSPPLGDRFTGPGSSGIMLSGTAKMGQGAEVGPFSYEAPTGLPMPSEGLRRDRST